MSLSKIGKLTSAFSSFKNNPLDLTNMATALASVGNVDNAAKYLVKINKQNGNFLGENAMAVLLSKAYRSSGINQEMAMGSINNALANSSKFSMGGMLGSLSAVGTGIATMFESIAPVIIPLIIAAVAAKAGKMAWDNFATNTAAKKQYQTSSNQDECTVASFRSSLWRMHRDFMAQGYITPDGLKTFLEMGKLYEKAGGNDIYHEKLLPDIESLEVRYTKDNVL